jgi:cell wall assembly regulator SMI1
VHDGQDGQPEVLFLPGVQMLRSLESIVENWTSGAQTYDPDDTEPLDWLDEADRTHQVHFHPRRIAFAGSLWWDYDLLLFDFDPARAGRTGQIIIRRAGEFSYVCETWHQLLERVAAGLDNGRIVLTETGPSLSNHVRPAFLSANGTPVDYATFFAS